MTAFLLQDTVEGHPVDPILGDNLRFAKEYERRVCHLEPRPASIVDDEEEEEQLDAAWDASVAMSSSAPSSASEAARDMSAALFFVPRAYWVTSQSVASDRKQARFKGDADQTKVPPYAKPNLNQAFCDFFSFLHLKETRHPTFCSRRFFFPVHQPKFFSPLFAKPKRKKKCRLLE